jgi:hypothetical protein
MTSLDDGLIVFDHAFYLGDFGKAAGVVSGYANRKAHALDAWDVEIKSVKLVAFGTFGIDVTAFLGKGVRITLEERLIQRKERMLAIAGEPEGAA